jgi:hypothetical protein
MITSAVEWLVAKLDKGQHIQKNYLSLKYIEDAKNLEKLLQGKAVEDFVKALPKTKPEK